MSVKYTNESFIAKANEIHHNKYDYSKTNYINSKEPIIVICPIHGETIQTPRQHLTGTGCPKCGQTIKGKKRRLTQTEWLERNAPKCQQ